MSSSRQILISLLCIAVFVLIVLIATSVLFSFIWCNSSKCSTTCERLSASRKAWIENVSRTDDHPDESWAEIPEILYSFFTPPPAFLPKETTTNKCLNKDIFPPVGYVLHLANNQYKYYGMAAVLVRKWVLAKSYKMKEYTSNTSLVYVRFDSPYSMKGGEVIRVVRVVYFNLLASLFLEHPIYSGCVQFAKLLGDKTEMNIVYRYYAPWPRENKLKYCTYVPGNVTDPSGNCAPVFAVSNNTYVLYGLLKCVGKDKEILFKDDNGTYHKWIESL